MSLASASDRAQHAPGPAPIIVEANAQAVPGLVWAFRIFPDGTTEELSVDRPLDQRQDGWLWLHISLADVRACHWIATDSGLPEQAVALMLGNDRHQQVHATDTCIYGVVADLVRDLDRITDQLGHLRFAMTEHCMITARHHKLQAAERTREVLRQGRRLTCVAELFDVVVEHVADGIDALVDQHGSELDDIEDQILNDCSDDHRQRLGPLRRATVRLHRQLLGLRTLFHRLERGGSAVLQPEILATHGRLVQRLDGLDHEVIAMRERARLLQDEVAAKTASETNRHLHALSIITSVLLPPALIAGIFGMNTKHLPLAETENGTVWALLLVASSSVLVYGLLRWLGITKR